MLLSSLYFQISIIEPWCNNEKWQIKSTVESKPGKSLKVPFSNLLEEAFRQTFYSSVSPEGSKMIGLTQSGKSSRGTCKNQLSLSHSKRKVWMHPTLAQLLTWKQKSNPHVQFLQLHYFNRMRAMKVVNLIFHCWLEKNLEIIRASGDSSVLTVTLPKLKDMSNGKKTHLLFYLLLPNFLIF